MDPHKLAELVSLALTVPTVVLGLTVVYLWGTEAKAAILKRNKTATQWFIIGVAVGFVGGALDNIYWAIPWSANFLGLQSTDLLMQSGVYFNIPFRQIAGIVAAYCHIRSAIVFVEGSHPLKSKHLTALVVSASIAGLVYSCFLYKIFTSP